MNRNTFLNDWSNAGQYHYVDGTCVGKWPTGGQGAYSGGCIGHDEPAINPFSDLPGSGGNVSWNVQLPVDGGPTHNQSDVYIAIWFGMDLYDPFGYSGQCFLELQMYPDTNGAGLPQNGAWSAFAVAWQIELATGYEDPCYAEPLFESHHHGLPLQMNQGDHLYVNMTGWVGSPFGENISVRDTTTGVSSYLNLFNTSHDYPLNPAFTTNNIEDSLPWSPGGDFPVAFAFESGHTVDDPENDTFGGCNSGAPPPTPINPSTPCGSYNPKDWAMDTSQPWHFWPVQFFNAHARQTASQYGFEQDFGATAWIDGLSYGTCTGRDGSAYCSYPWYSFDGGLGAFEFGATDYSGTTQDFGQYLEYDSSLQTDSSGLNFYPVKNFSLPTSSGHSLTLVVKGTGTVKFLNYSVTGSKTFDNLASGSYSINALPGGGGYFEGYASSGGVHVDASSTAWSSFSMTGDGQLVVSFGAAPLPRTTVRFSEEGDHGTTTVVPGFTFQLNALYPPAAPGFGLVPVFSSSATTVGNGQALRLLPGIYSALANPMPGYNFTGWTTSTPGLYVFTPASNYTWVNVTGPSGVLEAHYAKTSLTATVWLTAYPAQGGTIEFDGKTYSAGAIVSVPQGSYSLRALPAPGYQFTSWGAGFMSTINDFSTSTRVVVQYGDDWITAAFSSSPVVSSDAAHGGFALNGHPVNGAVSLPQVGNSTYQLEALPALGYQFVHWSVSDPTAAWVGSASNPLTTVQVNGSATIVPHFAKAATTTVMKVSSTHGVVWFDGTIPLAGSTAVSGLARTTYYVAFAPAPGYVLKGYSTSGGVSVARTMTLNQSTLADVENLAGTWDFWYSVTITGPGSLNVVFSPVLHPVTFIDFPFSGQSWISITGHGRTVIVKAGTTVMLAAGTYTLTVHGTAIPGLRWFPTSNLTVADRQSTSTPLIVAGSGTIYAVSEPMAPPLSSAGNGGSAAHASVFSAPRWDPAREGRS